VAEQLDGLTSDKAALAADLAAVAAAAADLESQLAAARQELAVKDGRLQELTDKVRVVGERCCTELLLCC
jgi:chromosome segregation ATPase